MNTSTLFVAGSPAKTLAPLEKELASQENALDYGSSSIDSSPRSARATRSSKTSPPFALEDWTKCSGHSLRSGMMRSGTVSPLQPLALLTVGTGSGLWRTPMSADGTHNHCLAPSVISKRTTLTLTNQVKAVELGVHPHLWPTPTLQDTSHTNTVLTPNGLRLSKNGKSSHSLNLADKVGGHLNPAWVEWLMGFPEGHTDSSSSETQSSPRFPN